MLQDSIDYSKFNVIIGKNKQEKVLGKDSRGGCRGLDNAASRILSFGLLKCCE